MPFIHMPDGTVKKVPTRQPEPSPEYIAYKGDAWGMWRPLRPISEETLYSGLYVAFTFLAGILLGVVLTILFFAMR